MSGKNCLNCVRYDFTLDSLSGLIRKCSVGHNKTMKSFISLKNNSTIDKLSHSGYGLQTKQVSLKCCEPFANSIHY